MIFTEKSFLILMLGLGCFLRLIWPQDMEWKADEKQNYEYASASARTGNWVPVGILNSQGIPNPPLATWVFTLFAKIADSPIGVVRCVQILNVIAVILFFLIFSKLNLVSGIILFSVSPMPIIYSRKIWQQCLLPGFSLFLIFPFIFPNSIWSFFGVGLGACLGVQIHQSGLFLYPILAAVLGWHFRKSITMKQITAFILGGLIGFLPLLPWVEAVVRNGFHSNVSQPTRDLMFFEYLVRDIFGLGLNYLLQGSDWRAYLGFGRHFGLVLQTVSTILFVISAILILIWIKNISGKNRVGVLLGLSVFLYGLLLTVLGFRFYPHYLIVLYPILHVGFVELIGNRRLLVNALILVSFLTSAAFLCFVHETGGSSSSEYGLTYQRQHGKID